MRSRDSSDAAGVGSPAALAKASASAEVANWSAAALIDPAFQDSIESPTLTSRPSTEMAPPSVSATRALASVSPGTVTRAGRVRTTGGWRDFGSGSQFYLWECLPNDPTQQFRWTGRQHAGGRAIQWHEQDREYCLDAETFSNGDAVIAYACTTQLLDHQIWAVL